MIYVFAIQLVSKRRLQGLSESFSSKRVMAGVVAALAGFATVAWIIFKHRFADMAASVADKEVGMDVIGTTLMGADKYQYVLPFEFISLFLLACIIGGLVILNDKKEEKKQ